MKLSVLKNNQLINVVDLTGEIDPKSDAPLSFFIGRGTDCLIQLDDRTISREQAQIIYENRKWRIKKASKNETSVTLNGLSTQEKELQHLDIIGIGNYFIQVELSPEETSTNELPIKIIPEKEQVEEELPVEEPVESPEQEVGAESLEEPIEDDNFGDEQEPVEEEEVSFEPVKDEYAEAEGFDSPVEQVEGDGFGAMVSGDSEKTQEIKFATYELEIKGEFAPFDRYILEDGEIFIGRDSQKCQIVIPDELVSSVHAVLKKTKISCSLEDLKSGNGTYINDSRINKIELKDKDKFKIGEYEFTLNIKSDFLEQQSGVLMPVEANQEIEVEEIVEVAETFDEGPEEGATPDKLELGEKEKPKSLFLQLKTDPVKRKKFLIGGVVLLVAYVLLDSGDDKKPVPKKVAKEDAKEVKETKDGKPGDKKDEKPKFTPEQTEFLDSAYLLAKELFQRGKYSETLFELQKIFSITKDYKNAKQIYSLAKQGLAKLEEIERKRSEEIERKKRMVRVGDLVKKAKAAVEEKQIEVANSMFNEIFKLDPENYEVPQLKLEIEAWQAEIKRKEDEENQKRETRNKMVEQFAPSKKTFRNKDWYRANIRLKEFLEISPMDEDLINEASKMLAESKKNLADILTPLQKKARTLGEGEDLKGAYEIYIKILFHDPTNEEAAIEMGRIKEILTERAKKIYRHAIISESLSLFDDAKEKFQEVQQISPSDSDYYIKATKKLEEYLNF